MPCHKILLFHLLNHPHWCGSCSSVVTLDKADDNNVTMTAPCFEQSEQWPEPAGAGSAEVQSSAPGAHGLSLTPLELCCDLPCCGQLLCNTLDGCCHILTQLKPRRTGQFKQAAEHPPVLQVGWDQGVSKQSHSSSLQVVKQRLLEGSQQPLQMPWTSPEGNLYPWPYPLSWRTLCPVS